MFASNTVLAFLFGSLFAFVQAAPTLSGTGQATFFSPGLGACGISNRDSDLIVAVSASLFDSFPGATANPNQNPLCGRTLTAQFNGRTVATTIVDRCPGCATNDLDFSPTAFLQLSSLDAGRLSGVSWTIG